MVVFGQNLVVFEQSICIRAEVVVLGKSDCIPAKVVVLR